MIRRISKVNDLKDIIKSCPSGVIDDITSIKYFIQGHPETEIEAEFEKVGTHLEAILPTSALETLSNGILMRRALYKVEDSSYPDGYYNLEFLDDMNVWLGDEETEDPFDPGYLTPDDLKTINYQSIVGSGNINIEASVPDYYATKSWVSEQGYLTSVPSGYATESWVEAQGYLTSETIPSDIATQSWVLSQSYLNSQSLTGYATESWVSSQQFATQSWVSGQGYASAADLGSYATESWVEAQGYLTSTGLSGLATISWVESQNYLNSQSLTGYATESWVSSQQFATQSWVSSQIETASDLVRYVDTFSSADWSAIDFSSGYVYINTKYTSSVYQGVLYSWGKLYDVTYNLSEGELYDSPYLTGVTLSNYLPMYDVATQSWVSAQGYLTSETIPSDIATQSWVSSNFLSTTALNGYATEQWVSSQQFATQSWVSGQGYLTSVPSEYATQSWVSGQGYLTSVPSEYATQSWVLSQSYITSAALNGYATESWVSNQQFATQSWATSEFFEESKIWTGTQSQWEQLSPAQQAEYTIALVEGQTSPVVLYETDGSTGLLGHNNSTYVGYWQLENLDMTAFSYIKCYFKATTSTDASTYTPAVEVTVNLDAAARGTSIYTGGVMVPLPFNRNRQYLITCAVDDTKTKFQVIHQNTLWDVTTSDANNNGRYLYKIEGYLK